MDGRNGRGCVRARVCVCVCEFLCVHACVPARETHFAFRGWQEGMTLQAQPSQAPSESNVSKARSMNAYKSEAKQFLCQGKKKEKDLWMPEVWRNVLGQRAVPTCDDVISTALLRLQCHTVVLRTPYSLCECVSALPGCCTEYGVQYVNRCARLFPRFPTQVRERRAAL